MSTVLQSLFRTNLFDPEALVNQSVTFQTNMDVIITQPNSLSMLWQLPQYVIITAAEIMLSITVLSFAFAEVKIFNGRLG